MERKGTLDERIEEMVDELHISHYHRYLLVCMISRKLQHPLEKTDKIMELITSKSTLSDYKKSRGCKEYIKVSASRELDQLEEALHECDNLPGKENGEELRRGHIVSNTVKYYAKKMMDY